MKACSFLYNVSTINFYDWLEQFMLCAGKQPSLKMQKQNEVKIVKTIHFRSTSTSYIFLAITMATGTRWDI